MNNSMNTTSKEAYGADLTALTQLFEQAANEARSELSQYELSQVPMLAKLLQYSNEASTTHAFPLALSIVNSREFGSVISAGVGGDKTELYNGRCQPGQAVVSAAADMTDATTFLALFQNTLAYKNGIQEDLTAPLLSLVELMINIARHFSAQSDASDWVIDSFTLNPLYATEKGMTATQVSCCFSRQKATPAPRPIQKIDKMLHPKSIGIIGVSATKMNFGRIILKNLIDSGYPREQMCIIRPEEQEIDGVACVEKLGSLPHKLDLFIVAVAADAVFDLVDEVIATDAAESVMLIPGGLGETEASRERAAAMSAKINDNHRKGDGGPIFLGGNCLGIVSHPGAYDSWFIPKFKLPKPQKKQQRNSALISQSGAFMITRISQNPWFDPNYMTALGNQNDLTHSDMVNYLAGREDIDLIGIYIEGFKELDGLAFAQAVRKAVLQQKQVVVYKAGQSEAGQAAALGHTASIAGNYEICYTLLTQAGAMVARTFTEFNDLFYVADCMHNKVINGARLGAVSGAGFEAVGMADSILSTDFNMSMGAMEAATVAQLGDILRAKKLDALMEIRNPFDINPGADDEAHVLCTKVMLNDPNIDAVVVGLDPLSPMMRTLDQSPRPGFDIHSAESVTQQLPELVAETDKPIIGIVDGGSLYDPMIEMLKDRGVCTFRSCDQGVRALGKYMTARLYGDQLRASLRQ